MTAPLPPNHTPKEPAAKHPRRKTARWLAVHLLIGTLGAACGLVGHYALSDPWQDPQIRVSEQLLRGKTSLPHLRPWPSLEQDIRTLETDLPAPTADVFRLIASLVPAADRELPDYERAAAICKKLRWSRCDAVALRRMWMEL